MSYVSLIGDKNVFWGGGTLINYLMHKMRFLIGFPAISMALFVLIEIILKVISWTRASECWCLLLVSTGTVYIRCIDIHVDKNINTYKLNFGIEQIMTKNSLKTKTSELRKLTPSRTKAEKGQKQSIIVKTIMLKPKKMKDKKSL